MKNKFKQFIALFLCAVMVLTSGMFSIGANLAATDNAGSEYAEAETEATADTASASSETTETDEPKTTVAAEETAAPEETAEPTAETTAVPEETAAPEETAEATASAEPAATSAPVKTEYDYSDSKVTVTATLSNPSIIPDDAQLVVTQITPDTEGYNYEAYMGALNSTEEEASADSADKYDENNTLLYDIAFIGYENDEAGNSKQVEYQPEAGSVKIDIQFHKNQLSDLGASEADDVEVMHLPLAESVKESTATTKAARNITADDITVKPAEESQADSNLDTVSFSTSSFSIFAVVSEVNWEKDFVTFNKNGTQIYYFNNRLTDEDYNALEKELDVSTKEDVDKNIKLIYHYVDDASETFQNTEYYNANRALGIAGNFHIVAFNTATLKAHTNGNILTSTLNAYSNFGTNSHDKINIDEVSYIAGNYQKVNSISANNGNAANALAVSNETSVGFADNGNAFSINNNKLDAPHILYRDSKTLKFIDLDSVKKEMDSVSSTLATDGGSAKLKGVTEEDNEQNNTFTITDPDGIGYINLKASDISSLKSNVYFKGFKSGHNGSIIVNVDMSDATTENNIKTVTLPERAYIYIDDKQQGTNEVVDFSAGKIIWNFINSDGAKIVAKNMSGSIIAPGADVELTQNINGTIIANNVQNTAETHRSDFTGIIKGDTTSFKVKKEFKEGDEWPDGSSYSFTITADDTNNQYLPTYKTVTLTKDKRTDGFGDIYFPYIAGHDGKTVYYYYTVKEDSSSPVNGVKYDTKQYNIKIGVEYSNNTKTNVKSATIKHILISTDGKSIDDNTKEWKVFNKNTDEFTFTNEVIKDNQKTDARLTVVKKAGDTGSALKGAGFTLYSGETAIGNEYKTNDDGKFTINTSDKALADYLPTTDEAVQLTLKETTVPEGYKAVTDQTVSITRTVTTGWDAEKKVYVTTTAYQINGGQSEMDLTDEKADTTAKRTDARLTVVKKAGDTGSALKGAGFTLYSGETAIGNEYKTNDDGKFTINTSDKALADYLPTTDEAVQLTLKETTVPEGYKAVTDQTVSITRTVTTGWDAEKKVYVTTTAYQINGGQSEMDLTDEKADTTAKRTDARLTVVKKAGDTGSALKGAGFTLYSGETAIGNEYKTNDDGKFTINTSDKALADYLPTTDEAVQLTLKETTVPEGYKAVTDQTVSITRTVTTGWDAEKKVYVTTTAYQINGGQSEMDLTDEKADTTAKRTDARLTVVKKAGDTGSALKGAGFTLYSGETAIGNEYKTNDDGKFTINTSDKALADYLPTTDEAVQLTLKETTVPEGYKAVTDQTVSITRTVTTGWDAEKKVYVTTTAYQINGGQSEMDLTDEKADTSKVAAVIISGTKTVNGLNDLSSVAGLFRFELLNSDNDNKVIDTAKNNAQGKFSFAKITYDTAGDYHYTVREINGGRVINGFRYSNQSYQVTVHVGDEDKDGVLAANISNIQNENNEAVSEIEFRNTALRSLHVAKIWDDNHNTAGMRPKSIQVQLFEDEKLVDGSTATLSAETGWSHDYVGLDKTKNYTVKEVMPDDSGYTPSQAVSADGNTVYLINTFTVNLSAHKTLKGALIQNGEFTFKLVRNSDPANAYYAVNDGSGNIYFNNIPYDDEGYTVTEVSENGDPHITYDADAITYDKDGKITSSKTEFVNTERPAVLRVQKTSKEEPHDPLVGAVYGLYMAGADGTNDVLVEAQTSDANGYMYYTKFQEGVWYYFKEISAPAGHEVDPYPGQKFEIKYQADGSLTMVDKDGKVISTADITDSISTETAAYVQINTAQTDLNSITADAGHVKLTSDSDGVKAVAVAVAGALPEDTQLQVEKVNLSKTAEENLKKQVGAVKSVAYYDVSFISNGEKVEPEAGTVTVTIQEDNGTAIPSDVNPSNLKLVHLLDDEAKGVAPVYGSIEVDGNTMHGASVTSSSFSIFGVVEPEDMTAFGSNYLLTASGVSDKVSKVQIAKLDTAGKYVIGADLQIIEKKTGKVVAEWKTSEGNKVFNRFFSEDEPLNVDTDYVLHEVSAPEGYQKADDIVFRLNKYDSSLSIWRYDEKGSLVEDTKSADEAVTDFTLTMTDKPIKVEKDKVYKQKTIHKDTVLYKNNEVTETITTTDKKGNKVTVTRYGTNTVNTGVANHTALYVTLIVIAAAAVIVITVLKNRKGKEAE